MCACTDFLPWGEPWMGMAPLKEQCNLHTWMVDASMEVDGGTGFGSSADDLALGRQALRAPGCAQGCKATICMPVTTPGIKVDAVRRLGAIVEMVGESYTETQSHAQVFKLEPQSTCSVHVFDALRDLALFVPLPWT